jgi:hypothetical protein
MINMKTLVSAEMTPAFPPERHQGDATVENEWQRAETQDTAKKEVTFVLPSSPCP